MQDRRCGFSRPEASCVLGWCCRRGREAGLPIQFTDQRSHRRFECFREFLNDQDRWHSQATFQETDVSAVQPGFIGEGLLGELRSFAPTANDYAELFLKGSHTGQ